MSRNSLDLNREAAAALMASTAKGELREIGSMTVRLAKVVRRLEKFSFPLVAAPLAGLLTRPENHVASARIESLIHLAAFACRGDREPDRRHLREWLNDAIYKDPITKLETPVEDVFVSNVDAWFGNARLFEGRWQNNAAHVRVCVETLLRVQERPWVSQTLGHVMALLLVSEAIAERAGIARNSRAAGRPGEKVAVGASSVGRSIEHVGFRDDELAAIGSLPALSARSLCRARIRTYSSHSRWDIRCWNDGRWCGSRAARR